MPYALEDQLIDDIEALHFALGQAPDGDRLPVATVDHAVLRGWLETCAQAGLTPVAVIPDPLLLPWQEGDWSVLLDGQRIVVRTGRWEGFVTEPETLDLFLNQALVEAGNAKPQRLRIWGSPPPVTMEVAWQVENEPALPLQLFAAGYRPDAVLNLLQGSLQPADAVETLVASLAGGSDPGGRVAHGAGSRADLRTWAVTAGAGYLAR